MPSNLEHRRRQSQSHLTDAGRGLIVQALSGDAWIRGFDAPFVILRVASAVGGVLHGGQTFRHALIHRSCGGEGGRISQSGHVLQYHGSPVGGGETYLWTRTAG